MKKKIFTAVLGLAMFAGAMVFCVNEAKAHKWQIGAWIESVFNDVEACGQRTANFCRIGGALDGDTYENYDRLPQSH